MQDESTEEEIEIRTGWEFKIDGSFVRRDFVEASSSDEDETPDDTYRRAGFVRSYNLGRGYSGPEITIWRKTDSEEFIIEVCDLYDNFGLIYCKTFPTLLEFFRRYGDFFRLAQQQQTSETARNTDGSRIKPL